MEINGNVMYYIRRDRKMNLNYELSDNVWWRPTYFSYDNKEFLKLIRLYRQEFYKQENAKLINDFEYECKIIYLRDCLVGEKNIAKCSTQYIEKILVGASLVDVAEDVEKE